MKALVTVIFIGILLSNFSGLVYPPYSSSASFDTVGVEAVGDLDLTYGVGGKVTTDMGGTLGGVKIALQPDGKAVVATTLSGTNNRILMVRYDTNGTLDTTFGGTGFITTSINAQTIAGDLAIQSDGKIVVTGYAYLTVLDRVAALVRYNFDGSLDTSFGSGGIVTSASPSYYMDSTAIDIQSDNTIIVGGQAQDKVTLVTTAFVARYNSSGTLDSAFGNAGLYFHPPIPNSHAFHSVRAQSDGAVLIGYGVALVGSVSQQGSVILRLTSSGVLDPTFDQDGVVVTDFGVPFIPRSMDIQTDNKILVGGGSFSGYGTFALARYNPNGTLDGTFGTNGLVYDSRNPVIPGEGRAIAIQPDGRILLGGYLFNTLTSRNRFRLSRYNPDGSLDGSFGNGGIAYADFDTGVFAYSMALQTDGKILLAGTGIHPSPLIHLARFVGGGTPPTPTPTPSGSPTPTATPTATPTPTPTPIPVEEIFGGARYAFKKRRPIRDVQITLSGPGGSRTTSTDNSGRYNFLSVPYGQYTVTASHPDYLFLDNPRVVTVPQFVHGVYFIGYHPN